MAEEKSVRSSGVVKRFSGRGFGFITVHGEEEFDLFVHRSEVKSDVDGRHCTLFEDDEVEFYIVDDGQGRPMAADVTLPGGGGFDSSRRRPRRVRRSKGGSDSRNGGEGDRWCNNCGGVGHRAGVCPSPAPLRLGEQQQQGRFVKDGGARGGRGGCYSCGEEGHFQRECQRGGGGGYTWQQNRGGAAAGGGKRQETRKCFVCQKVGHISYDCNERA